MKLSNRILGILLLLSIIGAFYIFYQVFFKIKLSNLEINSNISAFSGSLENIKFSKDFYCEEKKCVIKELPPFEYKINISKQDYKAYKASINLRGTNNINIFLEKNIILEKSEEKQLSKREKILELNRNKLDFGNKKINYNRIYGNNNYVYFKEEDKNKLYLYNIKNNSSFNIGFKPKINYIKKLNQNKILINSEVGSFIFDILTKKIEYFSLFTDFIIVNNNYIGIINSDDIIRKKNFDLKNKPGNILISYNIQTKEKYILKTLNNKISKIYKLENKIFIEDDKGMKFEIKGF